MIWKRALAILFAVLPVIGAAADGRIGIATGRETGTYHQIGKELSRVAALEKIDLFVYPSKGSIQNLEAVYNENDVQLAMTQIDVLYFLSKFGSERDRTAISRFKVVLPLYKEEIHIVAKPGIQRFADLAGKTVSDGEEGSGTALTAQVLFSASGIKPGKLVHLPTEQAIKALRQNQLDAVIWVAGSPAKLLRDAVQPDAGLHLLTLDDDAFARIYGPTVEIAGETYAWQKKPVRTFGIMSAMVTIDPAPDSPQCGALKRISTAVYDNLPWLIKNGHEKWARVDLKFPVAEDNRSACSVLYQDKAR